MKRSTVLALALVVLVLPAPADGYSTGAFESPDMDVVFTSSGDLKYVDTSGNIGDTGADAVRPGGIADFDGDGQPEIAFQDQNDQNLKYVGPAGEITNLNIGIAGIGGAADFDDDGEPEVVFSDSDDNLKYANADGTTTDTGVQTGYIGGVGDFDGDGTIEILHQDGLFDKNLMATEPGGTSTDTGVQTSRPGDIEDVDGDGDQEAVFRDTNDNLKYVESGGSTTDLGVDTTYPGDAEDIDDDGAVEIAVRRASDDQLVLVENSGAVEETAAGGVGKVGAISDFDLDGLYTEPPSIDDSSASPDGAQVSSTPVTLSADVSDPDLSAGDSLNVTFYVDGDPVGSKTVTSNGTVSLDTTDVVGGENTWYVVAEDLTGKTATSSTFTFSTPASLTLLNSTNTSQKVDPSGGAATVTFFGSDTVVERSVTDGTVDLTGLPPDEPLVAVIEADGYEPRRIYIPSLFEQQTAYLLPTSADYATVVFKLDDRTGRFDPSTTRLSIERAITTNGTTDYKIVAADKFGASGEFAVTLADDVRYRLTVQNQQGDERMLGTYTTAGDDTATLPIGKISVGSTLDSGSAVRASFTTDDTGERFVKVTYVDPDNRTSRLEYNVTVNGTVVADETVDGPVREYQKAHPVANNSTTGTINYSVTRAGETTTGSTNIGRLPPVTDSWPIDGQVLSLGGWILTLALTGAVVQYDARLSTLVGVGAASVLTFIGVLEVPSMALGLAGVMAVLFNVGRDGGGP